MQMSSGYTAPSLWFSSNKMFLGLFPGMQMLSLRVPELGRNFGGSAGWWRAGSLGAWSG